MSASDPLTINLDEPHASQERVIREAKRFNCLQCGRRFGKTTLGLDRIIATALQGGPAAWFAPTYKLLSDVWRDAKTLLAPLTPKISEQERRISLITGGVIDFWSLDLPDAGRGRKYKRIVIDEAGLVRDLETAWNAAIRPTLTDLKGDAWFLGTPKGHNYFQRLYAKGQENDPNWASWRMPTIANPTIDPDEVEAARGGMLPSAFNQEYLGIPADDGGNPFGLTAIRACVYPQSDAPTAAYGIDLAKSEDWTVVCGLDRSGVVSVLERWQSDWGQTRRRLLDRIGDVPTLVDSTGVGDPILEDLHRERSNAAGFKFTSTSKQQLMEGLAAAIQRGEIRFPEGWLVNELEAFEYEYREASVRYSAPQGMHDDGVCALALAVAKWRDVARGITDAWDSRAFAGIFGASNRGPKTPRELLLDKLKGR
jgi:hypothetical protein